MLPFSFKEYCDWNDEHTGYLLTETGGYLLTEDGNKIKLEGKDERQAFVSYINNGSFPMVVTELKSNTELADKYLEGIYNTILVKDVVARKGVSDVQLLKNIVKYLCSNVGSLISIKNITDYINSSGRKITQKTVDKYIKALTDSFLFYNVERYNIKGKQLLKTLSKYYAIDTGLCNFLLSKSNTDIGHQIENIVYFELVRRGYRVNIGKIDDKEIDFVAIKENTKEYYQVTTSMLDEGVKARELEPLQKVGDNFPKFVLTLDDFEGTYEGINQVNIRNWLLQK